MQARYAQPASMAAWRKLSAWAMLVVYVVLAPLALGVSSAFATVASDLKALLDASRSPQAAAALDLSRYPSQAPRSAAAWPFYAFLLGEVHRLRGETAQAAKMFQSLVEWSNSNPSQDGWGGNGLVSVALWRWLDLTTKDSNTLPKDKEDQLTLIARLWKEQPRLVEGMFTSLSFLNGLPQLKEEILRHLTFLAWSLGKKTEAQRYFVDYLTVARTGELSPVEKTLFEEAVDSGILSQEKVALFLGRRLEAIGDYQGAAHWLTEARQSENPEIAAAASFYHASLEHRRGAKCGNPEMFALLDTAIADATDPDIAQDARFLRARIFNRADCPQSDPQQFIREMQQLLKDFPRGRQADDALHQLAVYHLDLYAETRNEAHLAEGLRFYERLRQMFPEREDFLDSSWFRPALYLYGYGGQEKIPQAFALLEELERQRPNGPLHLAALFWLGRLSEEQGKAQEAKAFFDQAIVASRYDYYAIRARLHLQRGSQASQELHPDDHTQEELRQAFATSKRQAIPFDGDSDYHKRLREALQSDLYAQVLRSHGDLKKQHFSTRRLETIALQELDQAQMVPDVALLLSLRLDARAAVDVSPTVSNRLATAKALGNFASPDGPSGDWPLVMYLTGALDKPPAVRTQTQQDERYLTVAYPAAFAGFITTYRDTVIPAAFIYSVIRHESALSPTALSPSGALGLFQFIEKTFTDLDKRWHILQERKKSSREDCLLDPDCSIYLGARWFREKLLPSQEGNYAWALMEHNAGARAVARWKARWRGVNKEKDYEYMLETVPFPETRSFVRRVLTSWWVVQAAGLFPTE